MPEAVVVSGDAHAAAVFQDHPELIDRIVRWADDAVSRRDA